MHQVIGISKKKTAKVIPNAVGITTATKEVPLLNALQFHV